MEVSTAPQIQAISAIPYPNYSLIAENYTHLINQTAEMKFSEFPHQDCATDENDDVDDDGGPTVS